MSEDVKIPDGMGPNDPEEPEGEEFEEDEGPDILVACCPLCGAQGVVPKPEPEGEDEESEAMWCCICESEWEDRAAFRAALTESRGTKINLKKLGTYLMLNALRILRDLRDLADTEPAQDLKDIWNRKPR